MRANVCCARVELHVFLPFPLKTASDARAAALERYKVHSMHTLAFNSLRGSLPHFYALAACTCVEIVWGGGMFFSLSHHTALTIDVCTHIVRRWDVSVFRYAMCRKVVTDYRD